MKNTFDFAARLRTMERRPGSTEALKVRERLLCVKKYRCQKPGGVSLQLLKVAMVAICGLRPTFWVLAGALN